MKLPKVALETAKRLISPDVIKVILKLAGHGMNQTEIAHWLHTENVELNGHAPIEAVLVGHADELENVIADAEKEPAVQTISTNPVNDQ